jgi:class 3 adenylate cyclase
MRYRERHYRWEWRLRSSPERLWPLVADTNRFNRDTGLPAVRRLDHEAPATARRRLTFSRFGLRLEWDEEPFEWVRPHRFGVRRWYRRGPIASFCVAAELLPEPAGGTRLVYQTAIRPKSWLGVLAVVAGMRIVIPRRFATVFHRYDDAAAADHGQTWDLAPASPVAFAPGGEDRLTALGRRLSESTGRPDLAARVAAAVAAVDDHVASRLRPYALADAWGSPRRDALETCLHGARLGLFDLQWDLLCPLCRGAKASATKLAEMPRGVHCDACNIEFDAGFDRSVEVTFRPNPAIRHIDGHAYCVGGPQVTPHIVAQCLLAPGESRTVAPTLEPGQHRLRALGLPGGRVLRAEADGPSTLALTVSDSGWAGADLCLGLTPEIAVANAADVERLLILERTAWNDQAATAAEVIALQTFRDLFAGELLRPGEQIAAGSLTVLFTDLRDSTRLYRRIGDAVAFARVLDHFAVLREAVAAEDGAVVKTIGDAIMAVFPRPVCAVRAILAAQRCLACPQPGDEPLRLKAGLHHGPCLAATLNDRLDYFGSTVNLAARLERHAAGDDVIVSDAVRHDPEVAALVTGGQVVAARFDAELKGFDDELFAVWRLFAPASAAGGRCR